MVIWLFFRDNQNLIFFSSDCKLQIGYLAQNG